MLFNSLEFAFFFPAVVVAFFLLPHRWRVALLVAASYVFYGCWSPPYLLLIAAVTLVSYAGALWIAAGRTHAGRRLALVVTLASALSGLLCIKYSAFVVGTIAMMGRGAGAVPTWLTFVLPVGISFYTLQAVGYVIDVYCGDTPVERSLLHYALFVSFFPQLVAGPIERAGHLLVQFRRRSRFDPQRVATGLPLVLWGLFKKVVIADRLAIYVDKVYGQPELYGGPALLLATYFFAFQIYCDFSGYSDMAIGTARILGIDLMRNFRMPYLATSLRDFWRRWHISLSTWFRDYVYIPLGGGRRGAWVGSVTVVFILSGLWHGANLTFVVWGALHGILYVVERACVRRRSAVAATSPLRAWLQRMTTFHIVLIGWVCFRSPSLQHAVSILRGLPNGWERGLYLGPSQWTTALSIGLVGLLMCVQLWQERRETDGVAVAAVPLALRWGVMIGLIIGVAILGIGDRAFIYFQF